MVHCLGEVLHFAIVQFAQLHIFLSMSPTAFLLSIPLADSLKVNHFVSICFCFVSDDLQMEQAFLVFKMWLKSKVLSGLFPRYDPMQCDGSKSVTASASLYIFISNF